MLKEVLQLFAGRPLKVFVDGTLGLAGHSRALLEAHPEIERLIGIEQDPTARQVAQEILLPYAEKVTIIPANFRELRQILSRVGSADGMLFDLGVSSPQLDVAERGFSFMRDGPLDMRMDREQQTTAAEILNRWSEKALGELFRDYGEVWFWRRLASALVEERRRHRFTQTLQLVKLVERLVRGKWKRKIHPATQVFQALRIAVNDELGALQAALPAAMELLNPGGRLGVISFHSLEDRLVKQLFRAADKNRFHLLTKKPLEPSVEEIALNPRARSAKMRSLEAL